MQEPEQIPAHELRKEHEQPFRIVRLDTLSDYDTSVPHRHQYFELFIFEQGGGWHDIDFERIPVHDKNIHIVVPGQVHLLRRHPSSHGFVLLFSTGFMPALPFQQDLVNELQYHGGEVSGQSWEFTEEEFREIMQVTGLIRSAAENKSTISDPLIRSYLNTILLRCFEQTQSANTTGDHTEVKSRQLYRDYLALLDTRFRELHKVKEYARELSVSTALLNEITRKHSGRTAGELITERILLEIRRMLQFSEFSVKEIAYDTGFTDTSNFTKFFRQHAGMTPVAFREMVLKKYVTP